MLTHMPFLCPGEMVYAAAEAPGPDGRVRWKLHASPASTEGTRLPTGLPDDVIECSPSLEKLPEGVAVVFVGQRGDDYRFHRMAGPELSRLAPAVPVTICGRTNVHAGTANARFEAVDRADLAGVEVMAFEQLRYLVPYEKLALDLVARITFEYWRPWRMLVSGRCGGDWHTSVIDLKSGDVFRVLLNDGAAGKGVYKASLLGESLAYAARLPEGFEYREIRFAGENAWRLELLHSGSMGSETNAVSVPARNPDHAVRVRREKTLRANCAAGLFCEVCRNHPATRADLESLGLVDRRGKGCPRHLPWRASRAALDAVRPFARSGGIGPSGANAS